MRKWSSTCDYIANSVQPHCFKDLFNKITKMKGKSLLLKQSRLQFKIIIYLNINTLKK